MTYNVSSGTLNPTIPYHTDEQQGRPPDRNPPQHPEDRIPEGEGKTPYLQSV